MGPIHGRSWARGGPRWPGRNGRRQRAAGGAGPALQSSSAAREWGKSTRGLGARFPSLTSDWSGAERRVDGRQVWRRSSFAAAVLELGGKVLGVAEVVVG